MSDGIIDGRTTKVHASLKAAENRKKIFEQSLKKVDHNDISEKIKTAYAKELSGIESKVSRMMDTNLKTILGLDQDGRLSSWSSSKQCPLIAIANEVAFEYAKEHLKKLVNEGKVKAYIDSIEESFTKDIIDIIARESNSRRHEVRRKFEESAKKMLDAKVNEVLTKSSKEFESLIASQISESMDISGLSDDNLSKGDIKIKDAMMKQIAHYINCNKPAPEWLKTAVGIELDDKKAK